ncbi:MAG: hypothetical protein M1837_006056 [Sclerophora amabilis]|nr:MAG: hypothetical protein M1837_006056 [Sclerophora amabilis]
MTSLVLFLLSTVDAHAIPSPIRYLGTADASTPEAPSTAEASTVGVCRPKASMVDDEEDSSALIQDGAPARTSATRDCTAPDWRPDPDNWRRRNTDAWLPEWWGCANGTAQGCSDSVSPAASDGLTEALKERFAPQIGSLTCNVDTPCSIGGCSVIEAQIPDADQAYWTLVSIGNFNNFMRYYYNGINEAQANANSYTAGFVKLFSEGGNPPPNNKEIIMQVVNAIMIILAVVLVGFLPEVSLAVFSAIAAAMSKTVSKAGKKSIEEAARAGPAGKSSSAFTGLSSGVSTGIGGTSTSALDEQADVGRWIGDMSRAARSSLQSDNEALLMGKPDSGGKYLWDYLVNGTFVDEPRDASQDMKEYLDKLYTASAINLLWKRDRVFIHKWATSDCENDKSGPSETLPSSDKLLYPRLELPNGFDQLSYGLTVQDVMESSLAAYDKSAFSYEEIRADDWMSAVMSESGQRPQDLDVRFAGAFTIPVCLSTGAPPPIHDRVRQRYPCNCGADFDETTRVRNETKAFQEASGLASHDRYMKWCVNALNKDGLG